MRIGLQLPHMGARANGSHLRRVAQRAEALGFASVWVADHVAVPRTSRSPYSLDDAGRTPPDASLSAVMGENF